MPLTLVSISIAENPFKSISSNTSNIVSGLTFYSHPAMVAEWAKVLTQIQVEAHGRSQVQIPLGDV